jgi:hypothetical protein
MVSICKRNVIDDGLSKFAHIKAQVICDPVRALKLAKCLKTLEEYKSAEQ